MTNSAKIFCVPGYPFLLVARVVSSVIVWLDFTLIFSLLGYFWHASPVAVGAASALYGLPGLFLGPIFGRLADSYDPIVVLLISYIARGTTSLLLAFAPNVEVFIFLVFLKGLGNLGAMPAEQVLTRSMLTKEQLIANIGVMTALDQFTKIGAPLLAALMASWYQPQSGFGLSTFFCATGFGCLIALATSTAGIGRMKIQPAHVPRINALLTLLRANRLFRHAFTASLLQTVVLSLYDPMLAIFLKEHGLPAETFGTIVSCTAVGAIAGAALFKRLFSGSGGLPLIGMSLIGFGLTVLLPGALAMFDFFIPVTALWFLWIGNGCFYGLAAMSFSAILQTECPVAIIGTVSATARSAQLAILVSGPLLGSFIARLMGIPVTFAISGLLAAMTGLLFLTLHGRDEAHRRPRTDISRKR